MNPHLILLLLYSLCLVLLGFGVGKRVRASSQFFIASRGLGPGLLFSTMLAANIGAGSTVGATGLGYRYGLSAWWWVGSAGVGSIALGLIFGPRIWRIAKQKDMRTVGDFLECRYGPFVRGIVASILWLGTLSILAAQLIALAWVLNTVADIPKILGCLIGGLVMVGYFASGGLLASARVNLVQLIVLMGGFLLVLPYALSSSGGLNNFPESFASLPPDYLNWLRNNESGWPYLVLLAPAFIVSPGLLQKIFGARDERTVRLAVTFQGLILMVFAAVPVVLGMVAREAFPNLHNPELALPELFMHLLPLWLGSLGLAAVFSAEVSSADAILFMLSTSLSKDLYKRFLRPEASDADLLRIARIAAILGGALGVFLAILFPTVIGALTIFYALLTVSLFVPVVAGLFSSRGGQKTALASIGSGVVLTAVASLSPGFELMPEVSPILTGLAAAGITFLGGTVMEAAFRQFQRVLKTN